MTRSSNHASALVSFRAPQDAPLDPASISKNTRKDRMRTSRRFQPHRTSVSKLRYDCDAFLYSVKLCKEANCSGGGR